MPPDDGRIAVLDDDGGLGAGSTSGVIDRFLAADRPSHAVWRFVEPRDGDGAREAFTLTIDADGLVVPECCDEVLVTIDDRIGRRLVDEANGDVMVVVPDLRTDIVMWSTPGAAEDAIDWLDDHLGELVDAWARGPRPLPAVDVPGGLDAIPPRVSSEVVCRTARARR